jgi:hypothetical protein
MEVAGNSRLTWVVSLLMAPLMAGANVQDPRSAPPSLVTLAEKEEFLLKADIVGETPPSGGRPLRIKLRDGRRKHDAVVQTSTSSDPGRPDYRRNIAAYELDKALELNLVAPSVERTVNGEPAAVTWWVDDVVMSEQGRRAKNVEPPDPETWSKQMQAVRVFDELTANAYRKVSPGFYTSSVWDNLLITKDWRIWLIDHTRTFGPTRRLEEPDSLIRCDRAMLAKLRELNRDALQQRVGRFLTPEQVDALELRRVLIVTHFDEQIANKGEGIVLYDLPPRQ